MRVRQSWACFLGEPGERGLGQGGTNAIENCRKIVAPHAITRQAWRHLMANKDLRDWISGIGAAVNLQKIPTPIWHEHDGGPFIGTACMVIMKDPDSGWVNSGCYRIQTQGPDVATVMMSPGKHGRMIMSKYHDRNQPCPVAVV